MGYLSLTDADRAEMLAAIGVSSIDELFEQIPPGVRFDRELDVPPALGEAELVRHLEELAAKNVAHGLGARRSSAPGSTTTTSRRSPTSCSRAASSSPRTRRTSRR